MHSFLSRTTRLSFVLLFAATSLSLGQERGSQLGGPPLRGPQQPPSQQPPSQQQQNGQSGQQPRPSQQIQPRAQPQEQEQPQQPPLRPDVVIDRELLITDLGVIEDPILTDPKRRRAGVWSFKHLIEQMAGDHDPAEFALTLFTHGEEQQINGYPTPSRPAVWDRIIAPWLAKGGGKLDLRFAPVKLLAIVNRMDLRHVVDDEILSAGEGRFVFGVLNEDGQPLTPTGGPAVGGMTIILEYELPARSQRDLQAWISGWHDLGNFEPGTLAYNTRLAMLTQRFTGKGRGKGRPNGSALNQIRTNDVALATPWELREWVIDEDTGLLAAAPVAETPDFTTMNNSFQLVDLLERNSDTILEGTFSLPTELAAGSAPAGPFFDLRPELEAETFNGMLAAAEATARAGIMNPDFLLFLLQFYQTNPVVTAVPETNVVVNIPWQTPVEIDPEVRHRFALNTCSGCHRDETGVDFLHIGFPETARDRDVVTGGLGSPAFLSTFLTGGEPVQDPLTTGLSHSFNDLARRQADLEALINSGTRRFHLPNRRH